LTGRGRKSETGGYGQVYRNEAWARDREGAGFSHALEEAVLVGVGLPDDSAAAVDNSLDELAELARTAGAHVVGRFRQRRTRLVGATYIGKGKLEQLVTFVEERRAGLVIFDNDLTPAQGRNLEKALRTKVVDRSELILHIFAIHARTDTAKLQVELAQLEYALSRLRRLWDHLSRLGGGIGTRGPGETQLEVDRRRVRERVDHLRKTLHKLDRSRAVQRKARRNMARAALVGYTNAGKSTLLNRVSGAGVKTEDELFSTLDTTSRLVTLEGDYQVVVSDTVGFIRKLPHQLVDSFRATLAEVREADLLIHVVDAANEDPEGQVGTVRAVLEELGAAEKPTLLVLNKEDRVEDPLVLNHLSNRFGRAIVISALRGDGVDVLLGALRDILASMRRGVELLFPPGAGADMAMVYRVGEVLDRRMEGEGIRMTARLPLPWVHRFEKKGFLLEP